MSLAALLHVKFSESGTEWEGGKTDYGLPLGSLLPQPAPENYPAGLQDQTLLKERTSIQGQQITLQTSRTKGEKTLRLCLIEQYVSQICHLEMFY